MGSNIVKEVSIMFKKSIVIILLLILMFIMCSCSEKKDYPDNGKTPSVNAQQGSEIDSISGKSASHKPEPLTIDNQDNANEDIISYDSNTEENGQKESSYWIIKVNDTPISIKIDGGQYNLNIENTEITEIPVIINDNNEVEISLLLYDENTGKLIIDNYATKVLVRNIVESESIFYNYAEDDIIKIPNLSNDGTFTTINTRNEALGIIENNEIIMLLVQLPEKDDVDSIEIQLVHGIVVSASDPSDKIFDDIKSEFSRFSSKFNDDIQDIYSKP